MIAFLDFVLANRDAVVELTLQHLRLTVAGVVIAALLSIPAGIIAARIEGLGRALGTIANLGQTVPSLAILGLVIPLLGIGFVPALFALTLRALLPIFLNTYLGIRAIDPAVIEAARGLGMREREVLTMVQLPLAAPVILAGLRTAAVESVAIATLAAFIGGGGLGDFILQGIAMLDTPRLLAGAVPAALLAIAFELSLGWLERATAPRRR